MIAPTIPEIGEALFGERWMSEMARALGVSVDSVQDWKQGRMNPRPGVIADLREIVRERRERLQEIEKGLRERLEEIERA